jgi:hypothetical protein
MRLRLRLSVGGGGLGRLIVELESKKKGAIALLSSRDSKREKGS